MDKKIFVVTIDTSEHKERKISLIGAFSTLKKAEEAKEEIINNIETLEKDNRYYRTKIDFKKQIKIFGVTLNEIYHVYFNNGIDKGYEGFGTVISKFFPDSTLLENLKDYERK